MSQHRPGERHLAAAGGPRLAVLCVTLLLISLDTTVLNVALPTIVRSLGASSSQLQWMVDAYAVVFAGLLLSLGALGDRIGRKWVFMAGLVVFAGGSAFAAWSGSPDRLTLARAVMGVGAAALMPCTLSILTNVFTGEKDRAGAIGIWSGTSGIGVALGPILGGVLLAHFWWGSVFLVNVPIALIGLVAAIWLVPDSKNPASTRPDPVGAGLSMLGLGTLAVGDHRGPGPRLVLAAHRGRTGGSAHRHRLLRRHGSDGSTIRCLPLRFFSSRRYSVAISALALVLFALLGMFFLMTQYLQFVLGYSPLEAGVRIAPVALALVGHRAVLGRHGPTVRNQVRGRRRHGPDRCRAGPAVEDNGGRYLHRLHRSVRRARDRGGPGPGPSTESVMGSLPRSRRRGSGRPPTTPPCRWVEHSGSACSERR